MTASEKAADARLRKIYKKTLADKQREIAAQGGGCAICGRPFPPLRTKDGKTFTAYQDHDHKCCPRRLKVFCGKCCRGWLCFQCNKFCVGVFERMTMPLEKFYAYMRKWSKK